MSINKKSEVTLGYRSKDEDGEEDLEPDNRSHSTPAEMVRVFVQRAASWERKRKRRKSMQPSTSSSTTDVFEDVNRFRLTVDVLGLKDVALTEGHHYYIR